MDSTSRAARHKEVLCDKRVRTIAGEEIRYEYGVRMSVWHDRTVSTDRIYSGASFPDWELAR
jgi:hypothetical protein